MDRVVKDFNKLKELGYSPYILVEFLVGYDIYTSDGTSVYLIKWGSPVVNKTKGIDFMYLRDLDIENPSLDSLRVIRELNAYLENTVSNLFLPYKINTEVESAIQLMKPLEHSSKVSDNLYWQEAFHYTEQQGKNKNLFVPTSCFQWSFDGNDSVTLYSATLD